jgi:O-antigen/teichoic acid export membrane protein
MPDEPPLSTPTAGPRERVLANTIAAVVSQAASDGCLLLAALVQIRSLDPQAWGLFGLLLAFYEVVRVLTDAGLHSVGIRQLAIGVRPPRVVLQHILLLKTLLCIAGLIVAAGVAALVPAFSANRSSVWLLGAALFPVAYAAGLVLRFQAEHRMDRVIAPRAVAGALYLAAVFAGARAGVGVAGYIGIFVAYQFVLWLATAVVSRRTWPRESDAQVPDRPDWTFARATARQASSVAVLMVLVIAYSRLGVFLLGRVGTLETVGQYYAAVKLTEPLLALAGAFSMSAFPVLARLVAGGDLKTAQRRFIRYSLRSAAFTCALAAAISLGGRELLRWMQPEMVGASGALAALAWATVCMFQNQLSTSMINSFGKFHYVTVICAINLAVFLGLSHLLLPLLGATGAGLSLLGTEAFNVVLQLSTVAALLHRYDPAGQSQA